jgi:lipoate-protein ligase A
VELEPWRYLPPITASGALQMAIDTWLLDRHHRALHPPTLRFYRWSSPTLSLGHHQRDYPDFWRDLPIERVRRPTGGRAVLHHGDLSYAVVTSGLSGGVHRVYERVCRFLIEGWRSLGVELHYGTAGRGYIGSASCFGTATGADLVDAGERKFIGSAQLRRGGAVLQHGSMLVGGDRHLFEKVFGTPPPPPVALPRGLSVEAIVAALTVSAGRCFGARPLPRPLSAAEWREIEALARESGREDLP